MIRASCAWISGQTCWDGCDTCCRDWNRKTWLQTKTVTSQSLGGPELQSYLRPFGVERKGMRHEGPAEFLRTANGFSKQTKMKAGQAHLSLFSFSFDIISVCIINHNPSINDLRTALVKWDFEDIWEEYIRIKGITTHNVFDESLTSVNGSRHLRHEKDEMI